MNNEQINQMNMNVYNSNPLNHNNNYSQLFSHQPEAPFTYINRKISDNENNNKRRRKNDEPDQLIIVMDNVRLFINKIR